MSRAWLLVLLLACRSNSTVSPDTALPSSDGAAADSGFADATPADAQVLEPVVPCESTAPAGTVNLIGRPNYQAIFHDTDGSVLSQATFDAQGLASGSIPPCGAVTFAYGTTDFMTITHVMPGETISIRPALPTGPNRTVVVSFPTFAGATSYAVRPAGRFGCSGFGGSSSPITIDYGSYCISADQKISFLLEASDANGMMIAYAPVERVSLAASGTTTISVSAWQTAMRTTSATFTNLVAPTWPTTAFFTSIVGPGYTTSSFGTNTLPATGTHALLTARITHPQGHESGLDMLQKVVPATATAVNVTLDVAQDFAPHVSSFSRDNTNPQRPLISWTTSAPPTAKHAIAIIADYQNTQWYVIAPPQQPGALRFPDLPPALRPTSPPQTGHGAQMVMVAAHSTFPTYAELRTQPFALWFPTAFSDAVDTFVFQSSALGDYDQPEM